MSWWTAQFTIPDGMAETCAWLVAEALDHPVEVRDSDTMTPAGGENDRVCVLAFDTEPPPELHTIIENVLEPLNLGALEIVIAQSDDHSWRDAWRAFFHRIEVSPRFAVRPPWEPPKTYPFHIVIDPGMAFGTGTHPTTAGCLEMLDKVLGDARAKTVLDVGCGSGVLAIAAAYLGHQVSAVDVDADAVDNARHNGHLNGLSEAIDFRVGSTEAYQGRRFDVVVANIIAPVLIELAKPIQSLADEDLILSGLLAKQEDGVRTAYADFSVVHRSSNGDWVVLHLRRNTC